jgi:pimeloyl-ACP methyl ester carboxylesterase
MGYFIGHSQMTDTSSRASTTAARRSKRTALEKNRVRQRGSSLVKGARPGPQALERTRPYVDVNRVAVWGRSGGASNTLNLMFRHPELYKVGMAVSPAADQRLYDSIYQERVHGVAAR